LTKRRALIVVPETSSYEKCFIRNFLSVLLRNRRSLTKRAQS
jgi:hypothetical protein